MPRPIHFEVYTDNPGRTSGFYSGLFGWKFTKWEGPMPYWLIANIFGMMQNNPGAK